MRSQTQASAQDLLLRTFGLAHPILQGPMGGVAGPELVAAVANAGAMGMLPIWLVSPATARSMIEATQALTDRPFAVNLRSDLVQHAHIDVAINAGVRWLHLFWGDPAKSVDPYIAASGGSEVKLIATVGDADAARAAVAAGAVALIAQGVEAGGHVLAEAPLEQLLGDVLSVAADIPVIAAGGCVSPEDAKRLVGQGAAGVLMGTRFVASIECDAHQDFKQALIDAGADSTVRSLCFDDGWSNAPHRTLDSQTLRLWAAAGAPLAGSRPGEGQRVLSTAKGRTIARYSVNPPTRDMTGDIRQSALYAGVGAQHIDSVLSVADIVTQVSAGAFLRREPAVQA